MSKIARMTRMKESQRSVGHNEGSGILELLHYGCNAVLPSWEMQELAWAISLCSAKAQASSSRSGSKESRHQGGMCRLTSNNLYQFHGECVGNLEAMRNTDLFKRWWWSRRRSKSEQQSRTILLHPRLTRLETSCTYHEALIKPACFV